MANRQYDQRVCLAILKAMNKQINEQCVGLNEMKVARG